jgi:hypothetical protein
MTNEPQRLVRGKAFHVSVQEEWLADTFGAESIAIKEHPPSLQRGRIDVRMIDPDEPMAFVVELKDSDFDAMTEVRVRRNVARNRLQVSRYGETLLNIPNNGIEFVLQSYTALSWMSQIVGIGLSDISVNTLRPPIGTILEGLLPSFELSALGLASPLIGPVGRRTVTKIEEPPVQSHISFGSASSPVDILATRRPMR